MFEWSLFSPTDKYKIFNLSILIDECQLLFTQTFMSGTVSALNLANCANQWDGSNIVYL